ncbi:uncharacterized protein PHACADRAFT_258301 [Phanerochaete carnosa HHB-10118-sp]|uniref:Uncharacterized protein n=1 Tax=Phanerochaete carnosa (strain HHB-10118-sp) TaxID=650164 RepID=K5W5N4_PHACS|nr:uncharacterized protein PHACADRAFT_258301 [Phanerochaete carnosa HHB-10118-sp]EKM54450.1 hypothetical protein PHACADRAFT_258301 [Phanerochaete carnosa HHB-10118-sp]
MAGISSLEYYRTTLPGWGTSQLRFREPPVPAFQPLPSWSGWDYYRAYAINPDQNLYYTVMNRTRDFGSTGGAGTNEARLWQRRIYSGLVDFSQLLPHDIGMAAAYEAYRMWKYHRRVLFDPLLSSGATGAIERAREGLVGLAIAEASRLWQYTNRPMDTYGLRDCLESAALTSFKISYAVLEEGAYAGGAYNNASMTDQGFAPGRMPEPDSIDDPYVENQSYSRSRRYSSSAPIGIQRQPSFSVPNVSRAPPSPFLDTTPPMGGISIPGRSRSDGSSSVLSNSPFAGALGASPSYASGLGTSPPYGASASPSPAGYAASGSYPGSGPGAGGGTGYGGAGLATNYPGSGGVQYANPGGGYGAYPGAGVNAALGTSVAPGSYIPAGYSSAAPYASAGGYGAGYTGGAYSVPGGTVIPAQPGSTIVIKSRPRRHSHSNRHRSRSFDGRSEGSRYERY